MRRAVLFLLVVCALAARADERWTSRSQASTRIVIEAAAASVTTSSFVAGGWLRSGPKRVLDASERAELEACLAPLYARYAPTKELLFVLRGPVTGMIVLPADRAKEKITAALDQAPDACTGEAAPLARVLYKLARGP